MNVLQSAVSFVLILGSLSLSAQTQKYPKPIKPPVLRSSLGNYQGNASVTREAAVALIKLPLKVFEFKTNKEFAVSSYQVVYKQITYAEDENGKMKPSKVITAQQFKTTPLPELWISELTQRLLPGEEISFFDIIAKDDKGRVMYAPELNISVK